MSRRILDRLIVLAAAVICSGEASAAEATKRVEFNREIRPILSENCFHCHGADPNKRKAKLRLDVREDAVAKGAIVPGKPAESEVVKRIFSSIADEQMPPPESHRHLTSLQKESLRTWIAQGADYDLHWSFKTPTRPGLPAAKRAKWTRNGIDHFILARLEAEKLKPSPEAALDKLLRRASLDLTGLPPTPAQVAGWKRSADPFAAAVDDLLASPHFGERMATDWMDVARYADTHGFNNDSLRTMWRWRDWVIEAFNRNLPYDRFITEQLAGDLLPNPTLDQRIATGFNRNHVINSEGGIIDEEYRVEYVVDRVRTTSLAWLGLTLECARCHDHKYDPITQRDFYRLYAFFNSIDEHGEDGRIANASPILASPTPPQQSDMAKHREAMRSAEETMQRLLSAQDWSKVNFDALRPKAAAEESVASTNFAVSLEFASATSTNTAFTNVAGGKPFGVTGTATLTKGPLESTALVFDGETRLKSGALPRFDAGKGWAFRAWVRRDIAHVLPLFSTMNFDVPESSGSYGEGVEIRLVESGAVDVRLARRWPAYSVNVVTHETLAANAWHHLLVTFDGSTSAKGLRVFLDGNECFREVLYDDLVGGIGISGDALIGASDEKGVPKFRGALASVQIVGGAKVDELAGSSRNATVRLASETPAADRSPGMTERLHRAWLARENLEFAAAEAAHSKARSALLAMERTAPTTMVMREMAEPRPTFVLFRGQYDQPREKVEPGVPDLLLPFPESVPRNRLGLARWLTDPRHPLTARVVVNRFWQSFFGTGLVKSVEDFGFQADFPSHPGLLDWLAVEFVESGWEVKKLVRLLVTSATYRQDSRSSPQLNERDPENRLLARGPRQRLTAEMLRDQALALSGLLKGDLGGPPVHPYQPTNLYQGIIVAADYPGTTYVDSKGDDLYRRSLYTFWKRTVPHPTLATFDAPDREVCVARRLRTNTPLQALALMNDAIQIEAARKLAERMLTEGGSKPTERLAFAFQLATGRAPKFTELKSLTALLDKRLAYYRSDPSAAKAALAVGASRPAGALDTTDLAAYANVASLILNLDETITRN